MNSLESILAERKRQDEKWGEQNHDPATWLLILSEEVGEFAQEALNIKSGLQWKFPDRSRLREEAIHTAAVAMAIVESIDRNAA